MPAQTITVSASVNSPIQHVWNCFTSPEHVTNWNYASDDWHCPHAQNNLQIGGSFVFTMAAKDGSFSFDFSGTYTDILPNELIMYTMEDGRKVKVTFASIGEVTEIVESFDAEHIHAVEQQKDGWQAILDNFKKYAETT